MVKIFFHENLQNVLSFSKTDFKKFDKYKKCAHGPYSHSM